MGYSSWGHKESDLTGYTHTHTHTHMHAVTPVEEQLPRRLLLVPLSIHLVMGHKGGRPKSGYYLKRAHGTQHQKYAGSGEKSGLKHGARS